MADNVNFDLPANEIAVDKQGRVTTRWSQWYTRINSICNANITSGVTADRPTKLLWIGRRYFDTTLGKPVYLKSLGSPNVWVDGAGTVS